MESLDKKSKRIHQSMVDFFERNQGIFGIITFILLVGGCSYVMCLNDAETKRVLDKTEYFKVTNKDYLNTSNNMLHENYNYRVYFIRYDKDMKKIDCWREINRCNVTQYEYSILEVGKIYSARKYDIRTYGWD